MLGLIVDGQLLTYYLNKTLNYLCGIGLGCSKQDGLRLCLRKWLVISFQKWTLEEMCGKKAAQKHLGDLIGPPKCLCVSFRPYILF